MENHSNPENIMRALNVFFILALILSGTNAFAWNDGRELTHEIITEKAIKKSIIKNYLNNNLNLTDIAVTIDGLQIEYWLRYGSKEEDSPLCRASNHFHDPTKEWHESGLSTLGPIVTFFCGVGLFGGKEFPPSAIKSNIYFATGYLWPAPYGDNAVDNENEWDWENARNYYHIYLTGKDLNGNETANTAEQREYYFGKSLQALGQVIHLLQDMSVPAHTRDDFQRIPLKGHTEFHNDIKKPGTTYGFGEKLEVFVVEKSRNHQEWFEPESEMPDVPYTLTDFWDTDIYDKTNPEDTWLERIGIAEFANANFITEASINSYPHPNMDAVNWDALETIIAEDGNSDNRIYLVSDGPSCHRVAATGYFTQDCEKYAVGQLDVKKETLIVDEEVMSDYAAILIPKAILYSAEIIDYFFRGEFRVKYILPKYQNGVEINGFKIKLKNVSSMNEGIIESMSDGTISLVYEYIEPNSEEVKTGIKENIYSVGMAADQINTDFVDIDVTLSHPIPSDTKIIKVAIVFKGRLGDEENAVVAKVAPLESRIMYSLKNDSDNRSHLYSILPDGEQKVEVTHDVTYDWMYSPDMSKGGDLLVFEAESESDKCNRKIVVLDLASGNPFPDNVKAILDSSDDEGTYADGMPSISPDGKKIAAVRKEVIECSNSNTSMGLYFELVIFDIERGTHEIVNGSYAKMDKPQWLPDGTQLLVGYNLNNISLIEPDTFEETPLFDYICEPGEAFCTHYRYPSWAPYGGTIVYVEAEYDNSLETVHFKRIRTMNPVTGSGGVIHEAPSYNCYNPVFSPDGEKIAFDTASDIFSINNDGSELSQILDNQYPEVVMDLDWSWPHYYGGPEISDVQVVSITGSSATITWNTDEPSNSEVEYGVYSSYGLSKSDEEMDTSHSIDILNLLPATRYYFMVKSINNKGGISFSDSMTFITR